MKKLLVVAMFSSSLLFAGKPAVKSVLEGVKSVQTVVALQPVQSNGLYVQALTAMKNLVATSVKNGKEHYLIAGSAVVAAGIVALYYTNPEFKKSVQAWLGLDVIA